MAITSSLSSSSLLALALSLESASPVFAETLAVVVRVFVHRTGWIDFTGGFVGGKGVIRLTQSWCEALAGGLDRVVGQTCT